ncbi:hydroxysteroid dehydrogenase-like protein 2 [Saccoglossus kowalevskii]|uniref:Hydroxysteroid dehydrogenase-like protein 2 n=1 Tax=Saccoglossus kowalevskii TaxID=10224 RepID=A0ABM0GMB9_SACKO|nr:PREDICTED: hydroxysteroid dehydrogenase-like protein 2-like [Saccoglossus kowalevskii]
MLNTGKLAGRTIFITGASRGIGKAIALKAARDGANVVIAAKTDKPHPKLPGTIYTAAEEKDRLINISTETPETGLLLRSMARRLDPPSKLCIPYLKSGKNPHILNMSSPLSMSSKWFQNHVAYTMAKYGMSMCVLGMAEEFRSDGIAVNALWPRTAIITSAMEMLAGSEVASQCRKPEIMADAAYVVLTKDSKDFTGNFCIDDVVLKDAGVTDFDVYAVTPGHSLMPDFFLDIDSPIGSESEKQDVSQTNSSETATTDTETAKTFDQIKTLMSEELVTKIGAIYQFDIKGDEAGTWYLDLKNNSGSLGTGEPPNVKADCTMTMKSSDFNKMFAGKLKPATAFMMGKLKIKGDMGKAMKLEKLLKDTKSN